MSDTRLIILEQNKDKIIAAVNFLSDVCFGQANAAGWWTDLKTGESLVGKRNKGEMIALMHSELSEMLEGTRKNAMDDKLPHRRMEVAELADALIREFDYSGAHTLPLGEVLFEKLVFNATRPDHKKENRQKEDGKKF